MFETKACIHSLGGALDTVTIIEHKDNNNVIAEYKGKVCTAIYNVFNGSYYVDDKYGVIKTKEYAVAYKYVGVKSEEITRGYDDKAEAINLMMWARENAEDLGLVPNSFRLVEREASEWKEAKI